MLTCYRRHRAGCKHRSRRYKSCFCPIWAQGTLRGETVRKSLDLTNWEAAQRLVRDWEIERPLDVLSVNEACDRFVAEREGRRLSPPMLGKYKRVAEELKEKLGEMSLRAVSTEDLRRIVRTWKLSSVTIQKRLEMLRKFFKVCVDSGWIDRNPAKAIEGLIVDFEPTMPYSDEELEKIFWAADTVREVHP